MLLTGVVVFFSSAGLSPPAAPTPAEFYYAEGLTYEQAGNYALAEQRLRTALKRDPSHVRAYLALGAIYLKTGRLDEAKRTTLGVIGLLPRTQSRGSTYRQTLSMAYNNLGAIEAKLGLGSFLTGDGVTGAAHWEQSKDYYRTALELDPGNYLAWSNLRDIRNSLN